MVIEIGPGLGTLTKYLLEKAGKVIGIELDKKMVEILQDRFKLYNNFELYQQDVLKIDLKHLIKKEKENTNIKKVKILYNYSNYYEIIRRKIRFRKHNSYDTKGSC